MSEAGDSLQRPAPYKTVASSSLAPSVSGAEQVGAGPTGPGGSPPSATFQAEGSTLHSIDTDIDAAYLKLYAAIDSGGAIDWDEFNGAVTHFVRREPTDQEADRFFENATPAWQELLRAGM